MGLATLSPVKYGRLLARTLPKVIETRREYQHMVQLLEELDFQEREPSAEKKALANLLARLISDYEDRRYPIPDASPRDVLLFLMDQHGLRQVELAPILGSRGLVSDICNGKRSISKLQAKKLAEFFHVSAEAFI